MTTIRDQKERVIAFEPGEDPAHQLFAVTLVLLDLNMGDTDWQLDIPKAVFENLPADEFNRLFSDLLLEHTSGQPRIEISVTSGQFFRLAQR